MKAELSLAGLEQELRRIVHEEVARVLDDASPWLDVDGAAAYLCLSSDAVRALVKRNRIPFHKPSGRLLFNRATGAGTPSERRSRRALKAPSGSSSQRQ